MLPVSQTQTELGSDWYPDRVQVTGLEKQLHSCCSSPVTEHVSLCCR